MLVDDAVDDSREDVVGIVEVAEEYKVLELVVLRVLLVESLAMLFGNLHPNVPQHCLQLPVT